MPSMSCAYQYGRRDDGAAGGDAEGERSGRDLLATPVRGDEHVGLGEEVGDLLDAEEAVVEFDVILEAEVENRLLERRVGSALLHGARCPGWVRPAITYSTSG